MPSLFIPSCSSDLLKFKYDFTYSNSNSIEKRFSEYRNHLVPIFGDNCDSEAGSDSSSSSSLATCNSENSHYNINFSCSGIPTRSEWKYTCSVCQKLFERPSTLKTHMNSHTGERPFACPNKSCKRSFTVRSNMMRHHKKCIKD